MKKVTNTSQRKTEHIDINLNENVHSSLSNGFEEYRFIHEALPEINLSSVDTSLHLFGRNVKAPLLISSMTGGAAETEAINLTLAEAAESFGLAMGVGSQRSAIESPLLAGSFKVRKVAPNILLFANLGAVQLNYGFGLDECKRSIEMIEADALILHLNPLQEALQPEGDTNWFGLLDQIEAICKALEQPVIIKEVGWGISKQTAQTLLNVGIKGIDVAGAGGTSWSQVEMHRAKTPQSAAVAANFVNWGIPTASSLTELTTSFPDIPIFASGGLKTGIDVAKSIALGATLAGMAGPLLKVAVSSYTETTNKISEILEVFRIAMFATGSQNIESFQENKIRRI